MYQVACFPSACERLMPVTTNSKWQQFRVYLFLHGTHQHFAEEVNYCNLIIG